MAEIDSIASECISYSGHSPVSTIAVDGCEVSRKLSQGCKLSVYQ